MSCPNSPFELTCNCNEHCLTVLTGSQQKQLHHSASVIKDFLWYHKTLAQPLHKVS